MSASIVADDKAKAAKSRLLPSTRQQTILFWGVLVALLAIAFGMRLYGLGLPFDRDGYDEGVYWQTLLSIRAGYTLYQQIFYSQPPFFMYSTYPFYILFGGTLWSARRGYKRDRRSEEHTSELQSHSDLVCRLLLEKKKT